MATFPSVTPDAKRQITPGFFGSQAYTHSNGVEVRFLTATWRTADRLTIEYDLRDEATADLIREHYLEQEGGTIPFGLPSEVIAGLPEGDLIASSGASWTYSEPPSIEHVGPLLFRIIVKLEAADLAVGVTGTGRFAISLVFAGGAARSSASLAGMARAVATSISSGAAIADTVIVWELTPGNATGGATAAGADLILSLAFPIIGKPAGGTGGGGAGLQITAVLESSGAGGGARGFDAVISLGFEVGEASGA